MKAASTQHSELLDFVDCTNPPRFSLTTIRFLNPRNLAFVVSRASFRTFKRHISSTARRFQSPKCSVERRVNSHCPKNLAINCVFLDTWQQKTSVADSTNMCTIYELPGVRCIYIYRQLHWFSTRHLWFVCEMSEKSALLGFSKPTLINNPVQNCINVVSLWFLRWAVHSSTGIWQNLRKPLGDWWLLRSLNRIVNAAWPELQSCNRTRCDPLFAPEFSFEPNPISQSDHSQTQTLPDPDPMPCFAMPLRRKRHIHYKMLLPISCYDKQIHCSKPSNTITFTKKTGLSSRVRESSLTVSALF